MRPLRLLLSFTTTFLVLTLLLYIVLGSRASDQRQQYPTSGIETAKKSKIKAFFSFTSPTSFFPPSAIISLTDDNSTFFLARPAAFGPFLPSKGLSGPLWIGSEFGGEALGRGELGCGDVPGWTEGTTAPTTKKESTPNAQSRQGTDGNKDYESSHVKTVGSNKLVGRRAATNQDDGTDDYLQSPLSARASSDSAAGKASGHADIQSLQESAEIAGKIVLLKRGGCGFLEKVKWAQSRGGVALIVGDDVRGGGLVRMYAHGDTSNITIPALFVTHTTAHLLSSLLPAGGLLDSLSVGDALKLGRGKGEDPASELKHSKTKVSGKGPSSTQNAPSAKQPRTAAKGDLLSHDPDKATKRAKSPNWLRAAVNVITFGNVGGSTPKRDSRRPPSSGSLSWAQPEAWNDETSHNARASKTSQVPASSSTSNDFVIGEQDWRDPDLLPQQPSTVKAAQPSAKPKDHSDYKTKGGLAFPGSGEYSRIHPTTSQQTDAPGKPKMGWFNYWRDEEDEEASDSEVNFDTSSTAKSLRPPSATNKASLDAAEHHEGLWVTLTPTSVSSSPFVDTLLVLVVSPLVTLTVVYALLLLRSRIRRRRWRAPKSVVERLPVRTYHTISDNPSPTATPATTSPTAPLLQRASSRPSSTVSRSQSRGSAEAPATSSSVQQGDTIPEEEKRETGLAEWRRRYGGRQKECVVCLEEYVDGISRVMSLPCGHEFHADCITPWLVTRRRTCPICKGDVVRSLSQSYRDRNIFSPPPFRSPRIFQNDPGQVQAQAAETHNDSPSASRPVPIASSSSSDLYDDPDVEASWDEEDAEDEESRHTASRAQDRAFDLSGSVRELSSTVQTTIWRGFDAIRSATGVQRRPTPDDIDRDR